MALHAPQLIGAAVHGVPGGSGETHLDLQGGRLVATTMRDDEPAIRTTTRVELSAPGHVTGQLPYLTRVDGKLVSGPIPS